MSKRRETLKSISVFTSEITLLAVISNYEYLSAGRSWSGIGLLELRINRYKNHTEKLQKGNIIVVGDDTHKNYIILHREIELDEAGKATENWLIRGYESKVVTGERLALPPAHTSHDNKAGDSETVIKHYINNNLVNPVDAGRKISELSLAPNQNRGPQINYQLRNNNLAEALSEMSLVSGIGWGTKVDHETREIVFDTYEGRNLTETQNVHSPVIFSPDLDNIKNMSYVDSDLNFKNVAYIAGQGEGVDRRTVVLGNVTGWARREVFVDARDVSEEVDVEGQDPVLRPPAEVIADLINRGEQKLAEFMQETFLEAQIVTHSSFKYEVDWDLGDIVTIQYIGWGATLDARITEVTEIYEPEGIQILATFGNNRPTLTSKIKQELAGMRTEMTR